MKCLFAFLFLIGSLYQSSAQYVFAKQWDKRYGGTGGESLLGFEQTRDGGYILGGWSQSGAGGDKTENSWDTQPAYSDYWVVKVDSTGEKQWDKRYGGSGIDVLSTVIQTKEGGYLLSGHTGTGLNGDKTQSLWGGHDLWLVKTDSVGNKLWDKRLGGYLEESGGSVIETSDNTYLIGGQSFSPVGGDRTEPNWDSTGWYADMWIVNIDTAGNKKWDKRYGGIEVESSAIVKQTYDGGYVVGGSSGSNISGDKTQASWYDGISKHWDIWIIKIDSVGVKQWDKRFGSYNDDNLSGLYQTKDGGYILGGSSFSNQGGDKTGSSIGYWLVKIDSNGIKQWDITIAPVQYHYWQTNSLALTSDGGYLISNTSSAGAGGLKSENNLGSTQTWLIKLDSTGSKQWDKTLFTDGPENVGYAIQTRDGCYLAGNNTSSNIGGYKTELSRGFSDYWIIKFCMEEYNSIDAPKGDLNSQLQVWPNPFTSDLSIAFTGEHVTGATFTITNLMGQTVYQQTETNLAAGYTKMLDLSYLAGGVYFVAVNTGDKTMVERVVKSSE